MNIFQIKAQKDEVISITCDGKVIITTTNHYNTQDTLFAVPFTALKQCYINAVRIEELEEIDKKKDEIITDMNNKIDMMNKQVSNYKELEKDLNAQVDYYKSKSEACEGRVFLEELLTQKYKDKYNKNKTLTITFGITTGVLAGVVGLLLAR